ncbi:MAG: Glycosyl transferase family 2 [Thermocaproicibacter melissae]|jgi:glycosyltransferase involved in cell wall biosynthesis|uniref:tetratricopeptide repeat-containing glycosyltransferase family 2 protein n=1 Tax=Thermocaproicibacter melissae TaxID=2966552 RepID=UPI0024B1084E|nr:glycosyltransferase [Thermocaproicibacter melissae]WBY64304.1 glycosyltransferase [Thermocaproicibacter melissae]
MITVSVCMIVKNEEAVLARCLDSLKGIGDEIVIADTGSTDRTKEIAARYTDKVYDFPWNEDFAAARNFVLSKAEMEYIYSADADEVLDDENRRKFLEMKQTLSPDIEIVQMRYANQLQYNTTYNFDTELRPKLFRRLRTFRWVDPVHETVELTPRVLDSDITILHKPQNLHSPRDLSILERAAKSGKMSERLARMYAKELFISGTDADFLAAYPYFEAILHDENKSLDEVRVAQCVVSRAARIKNDPDTFFKAALKNVIGEPCAEVCCELGAWYFAAGDWEEAATWYYTAANGVQSELDLRTSGSIPLLRLAECYLKLGMTDEARECLARAEQCT